MKKIIKKLLLLTLMVFTLSSCDASLIAQYDEVYPISDKDITLVVNYGTPYYSESGILLYYIYRNMYYYPYYYHNRPYYYRYHRPLPPHRGFRPYHRPNTHFNPNHRPNPHIGNPSIHHRPNGGMNRPQMHNGGGTRGGFGGRR